MTMTIAEKIAAQFENDGQVLKSQAGDRIRDICRDKAHGIWKNPDSDSIRYEFADESAIVLAGDAWDIGIPGQEFYCTCWPEAQRATHASSCQYGKFHADYLAGKLVP